MASIRTDPRTGNIVIRAYAGKNPATGRDRAISETLPAGTPDDVVDEHARALDARAAVAKGRGTPTVASLVDYYLDGCAMEGMSPTTLSAYRSYVRCHVAPRLGAIAIDRVEPKTLSRFFRDLRRPAEAGGAALSGATVEKIHAFLSGCFTRLSGDGVIDGNPMAGVRVGRARSPEARPLSPGDFSRLVGYLAEATSARIACDADFERYVGSVAVLAALQTGMRRGEVCGLQRKHFVAGGDAPYLRVARVLVQVRGSSDGVVAKEPKSEGSKRSIALDDGAASAISAYMRVQASVLAEHRVPAGPESPLFSHADGRAVKPSELARMFGRIAGEASLAPGAHLHTLRHTHATYLIERGASIVDVQRRLGHASSQTTMDIYGHLLPGRDRETARLFGDIADGMAASGARGGGAVFVPECPLSGEPCARFSEGEGG